MGSRRGADRLPIRPARVLMPPHVRRSAASVSDVAMRFGGVVALGGVSFDVGHGQICGLIGPNGSGKTTLFNCISGIYRYAEGDILFEGRSLKTLPRHRMAGLGLGRTFQNVALFRSMSVRDNILVGAHHLGRSGFITNALRLPACGARTRWRSRGCTTCSTCSICTTSPTCRPEPAVRHAEARRTGARADRRAEAADARRTGRRPQPQRGR